MCIASNLNPYRGKPVTINGLKKNCNDFVKKKYSVSVIKQRKGFGW